MDPEKLKHRAYRVEQGQGKMVLRLLDEMNAILDADNGAPDTAAVLDLARAMSNVGGRPV